MSNKTIGLLLALVGLLLAGAGVLVARSGSLIFGVVFVLLGLIAAAYGLLAAFPAVWPLPARQPRRKTSSKHSLEYAPSELEPLEETPAPSSQHVSAVSADKPVSAIKEELPPILHTRRPARSAPVPTGFTISLPKLSGAESDASLEELSSAVGYVPNATALDTALPAAPLATADRQPVPDQAEKDLADAMAAAQKMAAKLAHASAAEEKLEPAAQPPLTVAEEAPAAPAAPVLEDSVASAVPSVAHAAPAPTDVISPQSPVQQASVEAEPAAVPASEAAPACPTPLEQLAALAATLPAATDQPALDGADLEVCQWAKASLQKAGCDTSLLGFSTVAGCVSINCIVPVLRVKAKARKPYLIVKDKTRLPKGCETGPCAKSEGAGNMRVYYGDLAGLNAFARLLKRNYMAAGQAVAEQVVKSEKSMRTAAEALRRQFQF